jgi:hypothetical protein
LRLDTLKGWAGIADKAGSAGIIVPDGMKYSDSEPEVPHDVGVPLLAAGAESTLFGFRFARLARPMQVWMLPGF